MMADLSNKYRIRPENDMYFLESVVNNNGGERNLEMIVVVVVLLIMSPPSLKGDILF